jgi:hypothetical protein
MVPRGSGHHHHTPPPPPPLDLLRSYISTAAHTYTHNSHVLFFSPPPPLRSSTWYGTGETARRLSSPVSAGALDHALVLLLPGNGAMGASIFNTIALHTSLMRDKQLYFLVTEHSTPLGRNHQSPPAACVIHSSTGRPDHPTPLHPTCAAAVSSRPLEPVGMLQPPRDVPNLEDEGLTTSTDGEKNERTEREKCGGIEKTASPLYCNDDKPRPFLSSSRNPPVQRLSTSPA